MTDIESLLRQENPKMRSIDLQVFADALRTYREAAANVVEHGAIVSHPRTGAPIENPYLKIQSQKGAILAKMRRVKSDKTIFALDAESMRTAGCGEIISPD